MPLYSVETDSLKQELVELRRFGNFSGYDAEEKKLSDYAAKRYSLSKRVSAYIDWLNQEQLKEIHCFEEHITEDFQLPMVTSKLEDDLVTEDSIETTVPVENQIAEENYFDAPELELLFDRIEFSSFNNIEVSAKLEENPDTPVAVKSLDRIFTLEASRIQAAKSSFANKVLLQKIGKVQDKIQVGKVNEASVLMSRFYNDNKQDVVIGYLYSEILYAKAAMGNQKALSKARDVSNTVCFLTDKSDEVLISYYRYLFVCREYLYDKARALQLFREFVLIEPDKFISPNILTKRGGFFLKCLLLFLKFDVKDWGVYEIETMHSIISKSLAGGVFYIAFLRNSILPNINKVRFQHFLQIETELYNIQDSHAKLIQKIQSSFDKNGFPKVGSSEISTVGQKYLHDLFKGSKLPNFSEYLTNTSLSSMQHLEATKNDRYLATMGISEHSLWRAWISKITAEKSLQRADLIPIEQVLKESKLLARYESLINKMHDYELEIYNKQEYKESRELLTEVTSAGIIKVIVGENKHSVLSFGAQWTALQDYFSRVKSVHTGIQHALPSQVLLDKGRAGLFWNLEELQMMVESVNLMLDSKTVGIKARLENITNLKSEPTVDEEYMSLSEHLELYWWVYVLMVSLLIFFFNLVS